VDTDRPEQLVPIRLEFDVEHHKMRDTFVWNLNGMSKLHIYIAHPSMKKQQQLDPIVTPENFAQTIVEDYNLSANYHAVIVKSINDQLMDFKAHSGLYDADGAELSSPILGIVGVGLKPGEDTLKQGVMDEENGKWWGEWRKRLNVVEKGRKGKGKGRKRRKVKEEDGVDGDVEDGFGMDVETETVGDRIVKWEKPLPLEEIDVNEQMMHEDMRILIRVGDGLFVSCI
jgi:SWI/SNF-related matrix-associated actin-dependent regulator of chromatin subfamily B protein 1